MSVNWPDFWLRLIRSFNWESYFLLTIHSIFNKNSPYVIWRVKQNSHTKKILHTIMFQSFLFSFKSLNVASQIHGMKSCSPFITVQTLLRNKQYLGKCLTFHSRINFIYQISSCTTVYFQNALLNCSQSKLGHFTFNQNQMYRPVYHYSW